MNIFAFITPFLRLFCTALLLFIVSSCAFFQDEVPLEQRPRPLNDFESEMYFKPLWSADIGSEVIEEKHVLLKPALSGDRLCFLEPYGVLTCLQRRSGKVLWQKKFANNYAVPLIESLKFWKSFDESWVSTGLSVVGEALLFTSRSGDLYSVSIVDGSVNWKVNLLGEALTIPVVDQQDQIYVRLSHGTLVALDLATGRLLWHHDEILPPLTLRGASHPLIKDGVVISGFDNGKVVALSSSNGAILWQTKPIKIHGNSDLDRLIDIDTAPILFQNNIFLSGYNGVFQALRYNGSTIWEKPFSTYLDMATGYGQIYLIDDKNVVFAYNTRGDIVWKNDQLFRRGLSDPQVMRDSLLLYDNDAYLHVLAQSDGRIVARHRLSFDQKIISDLLVEGRELFLYDSSGKLHAFLLESL